MALLKKKKSLAPEGFRTPDRPASKPSHYIDYGVLTVVKGLVTNIFVLCISVHVRIYL
jgi:hypothetical protein